MNEKTKAALAEIERAVARDEHMIAAATFSHCFGRVATAAAFRVAKARGIIELAYTSAAGTPVWRGAGVGAAVVEASGAVKN